MMLEHQYRYIVRLSNRFEKNQHGQKGDSFVFGVIMAVFAEVKSCSEN